MAATKDPVKEETERKISGEITRQRQRLHKWERTSGHQTRIHVVGDSMLVVSWLRGQYGRGQHGRSRMAIRIVHRTSCRWPIVANITTNAVSGMRELTPGDTGQQREDLLGAVTKKANCEQSVLSWRGHCEGRQE